MLSLTVPSLASQKTILTTGIESGNPESSRRILPKESIRTSCQYDEPLSLHAGLNPPPFIEDLLRQFKFSRTAAYSADLPTWEQKFAGLDGEFFHTPAFRDVKWEGTGRDDRHTIARFSVYGFHHRVCSEEGFHDQNQNCICLHCESLCDRDHALKCAAHVSSSLKELGEGRLQDESGSTIENSYPDDSGETLIIHL